MCVKYQIGFFLKKKKNEQTTKPQNNPPHNYNMVKRIVSGGEI